MMALVLLGMWIGTVIEKADIANAIRSGNISLQQRVESVADQIESGHYRKVGQ
jgi:hypothetical protein